MVFEYDNYKDLLKYLINNKKKMDKSFTMQKMATACHIQKTYLSRVINSFADLSEDQVYLAGLEMNLNNEEAKFFSLLHQRDRSGVKRRSDELTKEINLIKKINQRSEKHIQVQPLKSNLIDNITLYYLDINFQLIHVFLTIERFSKSPALLINVLSLTNDKLQFYLNSLVELGIIEKKDTKYVVVKDNLHLSKDSPVFQTYRRLTRDHCLNKLEKLDSDNQYSFSVTFSTSPEVQSKIHREFLKFLSK